jgi:hypothetical protein
MVTSAPTAVPQAGVRRSRRPPPRPLRASADKSRPCPRVRGTRCRPCSSGRSPVRPAPAEPHRGWQHQETDQSALDFSLIVGVVRAMLRRFEHSADSWQMFPTESIRYGSVSIYSGTMETLTLTQYSRGEFAVLEVGPPQRSPARGRFPFNSGGAQRRAWLGVVHRWDSRSVPAGCDYGRQGR